MWIVGICIAASIVASIATTKMLATRYFEIVDGYVDEMCKRTKKFVDEVCGRTDGGE